MLTHLKLKEGDTMLVVPTPNGYLITSKLDEVEEQIKLGIEFMNEYNETFRQLAK